MMMMMMITLADSQTFYQMSVFNSKTHNLQMQKYDISMTSPAAKIFNFSINGVFVASS